MINSEAERKRERNRIIIALDFPNKQSALDFIAKTSPDLCHLKIGKGMFTAYGPEFVKEVIAKGFSVFLDLKFHDIPNTVFDACTAAAHLGAWMINVHVSGGEAMLKAARQAVDKFPRDKRPLLIGVTLLTSMDQSDLDFLGIKDTVQDTVVKFALLAKKCGLDGVVCSAQEAKILREKCGPDFLLVTPGIRFDTDSKSDQKRVMTPQAAFAAGVDYIVLGRAITESETPITLLKSIK